MDIISYGIASKAAKQEQFTRNDVLGIGVEGSYSNVKTRIDNLEKAIQGVVAQADKLIVNDAINIMKAHAKLNAVAKSMKYKMYNMIFDDLLDLSGIDVAKSSGYVHDATNGLLKSAGGNYVIETKEEIADTIPTKAILTVEEDINSKSLNFKGSTVTISGIPVNTTPGVKHTVEFWMKWNGTNSVMPIGFYQYDLWINNEKFGFNTANSDITGISFPASTYANKWIHVAAVFFNGVPSAMNNELYINGIKQNIAILNSSPTSKNVTSNMNISGWPFDNRYRFGGLISDVRIWAGARTEREIQDNMYKRLIGTEPNLIGYWKLNGDANDYSSYGKHGSISGSVEWVDDLPFINTSNQINGKYYISRDNGNTWEPIAPETLFYFNDNISLKDNKIRIKAELPADIQLLNYALTWA